jgi:hypothetical protein
LGVWAQLAASHFANTGNDGAAQQRSDAHIFVLRCAKLRLPPGPLTFPAGFAAGCAIGP